MLASNPLHFVNQRPMFDPVLQGHQQVLIGMGCFWGAERLFWKLKGVYVTSVGYSGGTHKAPDYSLVCSGSTGHAEVVHIIYDPAIISFSHILKIFFENHDPTQGNRQGNDIGTQYRSVIYTFSETQYSQALAAKARYQKAYLDKGAAQITTEIQPASTYYPAEGYHQQYLAKNPDGYCGIGGTGIVCPLPQFESS